MTDEAGSHNSGIVETQWADAAQSRPNQLFTKVLIVLADFHAHLRLSPLIDHRLPSAPIGRSCRNFSLSNSGAKG